MKKSFLIAVGVAVIFGGYGYLASNAGHDHSSHSNETNQTTEGHSHGKDSHEH